MSAEAWTRVHGADEPLWQLARAFAWIELAMFQHGEIIRAHRDAGDPYATGEQREEAMERLLHLCGALELRLGPGFLRADIPVEVTADNRQLNVVIHEGRPFRWRPDGETEEPQP